MADVAKLFNLPGNVKFNVKSKQLGKLLSAQELADLAEHMNRTGVVGLLNDLTKFSEEKGVLIPDLVIRVGTTELVVKTQMVAGQEPVVQKLPWYNRPIGSFFRRR